MTGENSAKWMRATEEERLAVIEAFARNTTVTSVEMVNSLVNDRLGEAWGRVLKANNTITSLNLEFCRKLEGEMTK